jgi:hypothetical protein
MAVAVYVVLLLLKCVFVRMPRINRYYFLPGIGSLGAGLLWLLLSLYLHNRLMSDICALLFHFFIGISIFYIQQSIDKDRELEGVSNYDI